MLRSFLFTQKKEKVHFINGIVFTARKRSLRRLCFHRRLSGHRGALGLCPGGLSLGGLCPGGGGLCPGEGVSVQGRGSLSRGWGLCPGEGGLCPGEGGLFPGEGGLCPGKGSLSGGMGSLSGDLCLGGLCPGGLCSGESLFRGVSVKGVLCPGDVSVRETSPDKDPPVR